MAHFDITNPNQRNSRLTPPSSDGEVQEFIPVTADTPVEVAAPPADPQENAALPEQPKAEVEAPVPSPTDAEPTTKTPSKRGRRSKSDSKNTAKPASKSAAGADESRTKKIAFYVTDSIYMRLRHYTVDQRTTFTEVMEDVAMALLDHSFRCKEADCNCEFIIRSTLSDATPVCPCCGSKRIERTSKF